MDHPKTSTVLHSGWSFKQRNSEVMLEADFAGDGWRTAQVPGTAHTDLMTHGLIPDPFFGLNELDVQWVGETDWLYKLEFEMTEIPIKPRVRQTCVSTVWTRSLPFG